MSTIALLDSSRQVNKAQLNKALWARFMWKEYRMLRGFWLAILLLGVLEQWVSTLMMVDARIIPSWLFSSAWGAAALYAVGAAVTLFGAENEERTRGFLQLLPGRWQPMFFAKLAVAVGSAVLLAGVLSLTGWITAGGEWPTWQDCLLSISVAGVAIVEATAWGLLFSLLWKQPLMAAVAAMAVASFGSQLAILATPDVRDSFSAESYQAAVPMRLAICLVVFAFDVLIGSYWLAPLGTVGKRRRESSVDAAIVAAKPQAAVQPWRRRMIMRLLWQTWRESWKTILAAIVLGLLLTFSFFVPTTLLGPGDSTTPWLILPLLILPALFGALAFRADQKRNHRLFLATHSAQPRLVWLARQVVWLGALIVVLYGIRLSFWRIVPVETAKQIASSLMDFETSYEFRGDYFNASEGLQRWWQGEFLKLNHRMTVGTWSAILAAYGLGQFFSLAFKREVLAGFLAILFSTLLAAWSLVVFVWQLNPYWFVLPLAAGGLAATWLRMPRWLVGKNSAQYWLLPAVSLGLPMLIVALCLPFARMAQLNLPWPNFPFLQESLEASLKDYEQKEPARQELALLLEQLAAEESLAKWTEKLDGIQVYDAVDDSVQFMNSGARLTRELSEQVESLSKKGDLDEAWRYLAVMAKINVSYSLIYDPDFKGTLHKQVAEWATAPSQTSLRIKRAVAELEKIFNSVPKPRERILSEYVRTREVLFENELPQSLNKSISDNLPFLSNKLFWERQRAQLALHYFATQAINYCDAVEELTNGKASLAHKEPDAVRELLRMAPYSQLFAINKIAFEYDGLDFTRAYNLTYASSSSFLTAKEFGRSNSFNQMLLEWAMEETNRRALLLELALLAYQLDHEAYPEQLDELIPDYLAKLPLDPFSGREFVYHFEGLELPLSLTTGEIFPYIPLFWSVGPFNRQLQKTTIYEGDGFNPMGGMGGEGGYGGEIGGYGDNKEIIEPRPGEIFQPPLGKRRKVYLLEATRVSGSLAFVWRELIYVLPIDLSEEKKTAE